MERPGDAGVTSLVSVASMVVRAERTMSHVTYPVRPRRVEVTAVRDLTPRMRRVTLAADDLRDLPTGGPTDHLKLFFPPAGSDDPVEPEIGPRGLVAPPAGTPRPYREYTVRRHDPAAGELDVDFVLHGHGLAGGWAADARPGRTLWALGPRTSAVVAPRDWYLVGGDETALPAIGRWLETLPAGAPVTVLAEVADADAEQDLPTAADATIRWLHRDGAAPGTTHLLSDALDGFTPPPGEGFAWMGAEAAALRPVRRRLRDEVGLGAEAVDLDGYWRRGVEGTGLG